MKLPYDNEKIKSQKSDIYFRKLSNLLNLSILLSTLKQSVDYIFIYSIFVFKNSIMFNKINNSERKNK